MKITVWLTLFFLTIFLTKIAVQNDKTNVERSMASEKNNRINFR